MISNPQEKTALNTASAFPLQTLQSKLKLFFALSRTPHGLIDMAAPALAALLCLGRFPSALTTIIGLITVFAGYTAVYALNDLVDLHADKQKVDAGGYRDDDSYLDGVMVRHPMAKGVLRFRDGLFWAGVWALVALLGAYWLNPVCLYIFVGGAVLEAVYCKLWQVTPLRAVVNGVVKTLGPIAAIFAVDPSPSAFFVLTLFAWLFAWEIGGQNIPNDWTDIEEDRRMKAKTIPIELGLNRATLLVVPALAAALILNILVLLISPLSFHGVFPFLAVVINLFLLLHPGLLLHQHQQRQYAMRLFNKASYYPLAMLGIVLMQLIFNTSL